MQSGVSAADAHRALAEGGEMAAASLRHAPNRVEAMRSSVSLAARRLAIAQ